MNNIISAAQTKSEAAVMEYQKWADLHIMKATITMLIIIVTGMFFVFVHPFMLLFMTPAMVLRKVYMIQESKRLKAMKEEVDLSQRMVRQLIYLHSYNLSKVEE